MIKVQDLVFKYAGNDTNAIDHITLSIPKGKYTAIMGHNGSGKSTLSKLLVGLYKPTSGSIIIDGITISRETLLQIRHKVGMVFQNPDNQFVGASVEDDIAFGLENKKLARKAMRPLVEKYAAQVGMLMFLDKEPHRLSGGQKQRVAIASTLALDPEIIIFDEVTSMLDPKGKHEVLGLIQTIQRDSAKTLISITHDMDEAILADHAIVLANGKVIAEGKPATILANEEVTRVAKIDAPFYYRFAEALQAAGVAAPLTHDGEAMVKELCK